MYRALFIFKGCLIIAAKLQNKAIGQQKPCIKEKCIYLRAENKIEMSARQIEITELIKQLGKEILPGNAKLVLFGSQARDDAHADSDSTAGFFHSFHWVGHLALKSIQWLILIGNGSEDKLHLFIRM